MEFEVIDAHVHCGKGYEILDYLKKISETNIKGAVIFPLSSDIYPKGKKDFKDNQFWREKRKQANRFILEMVDESKEDIEVYPFKYIWNDFDIEDIDKYFGIKWHRKQNDPEYLTNSKKFKNLLEALIDRKMPIVFVDELENTINFVKKCPKGINVIIPHMGFGNKSHDKLRDGYYGLKDARVWNMPNVFTDTSYANDVNPNIIKEYLGSYGHERIMFGTDFPNFEPSDEIKKFIHTQLRYPIKKAIAGENLLRLLKEVRNPKK